MEKIKIGTRGSALALAQTELVIRQIKEKFPEAECEVCTITTKGDKILDKPLVEFGGKGVFLTEIEEKLMTGEIDLAVHSAKDMPMELEKGLDILAVLKREDPRDVLVTMDFEGFLKKEHPVVGTSSLRRQVQIQQIFPKVVCQTLRGNVNTRLKKLEEGMYDGILLAAAGLNRLGLEREEKFHYYIIDIDRMIPAGGQGIIVVEGKKDSPFAKLLESITHKAAKRELEFERMALKLLEAGCHEPVGVYTKLEKSGKINKKNTDKDNTDKNHTASADMLSIWMCRDVEGQLRKKMTKVSVERAEEALTELAGELRKQERK